MDNNIERKIKQEYIDYCNEMQKGYLEKRIDEIFGRFHYKVKTNLHRFKKKIINLVKNKKEVNMSNKKVGRISAVFMAGTLALLGTTTAGESNRNSTEVVNNEIENVDTNKGENNFKKSLYVQALEKTTTPTKKLSFTHPTTEVNETIKENNEKQQDNKNIEYIESEDDVYILKANTIYTENSLGEGETGYISKDTKVKTYNRALVNTDKNGKKTILYVTNPGEKWEDYAKRQGQNYEEFKSNFENPNNKEMVSLDSEEGKSFYGWVESSTLQTNKGKQRGEIDR